MSDAPLRLLIAEDSLLLRTALVRALAAVPGCEVAAAVADGVEAVEATLEHRPDVILMDVRMPRLGGLEATQQIMARRPTPILLMTSPDNLTRDLDLSLQALEYGALDMVNKGDFDLLGGGGAALWARLRLLSGVPVISHLQGIRGLHNRESDVGSNEGSLTQTTFHRRAKRLVAIASSTGGPSALKVLLSGLPPRLGAAVVIVQHIDPAFQEGLVRWLDEESPLRVVLARDQQDLHDDVVYMAPQGTYCEVTERRRLTLIQEPIPSGGHCPSGDRLLLSTANTYGRDAMGVVLTGMGVDGAAGLKALREVGGETLAQDESTSVIYGMPRAAWENGGARLQAPLPEIAAAIARVFS